MEPTMTIVAYLYSGRNTWLRCSEECVCSTDEEVKNALDQILVEQWLDIHAPYVGLKFRTASEWDQICGPAAEQRVLQNMSSDLLSQAADIMSIAATKERLSGE